MTGDIYNIDDLIQLSALQHYAFCPRQCALIHLEQVWSENLLTAEGRIMHEHVHEEGDESRGDVRIGRGIPLRSLRLGLIGKADVVEYHRQPDGSWRVFPVEYKRGKPKVDESDKIQLCAQAICLEEMMEVNILSGAIFYGRTRRRLDVSLDAALRQVTRQTAEAVRQLLSSGTTPQPVYANRCENCSLVSACLPKTIQKKRTVAGYLKRILEEK